MSVDLETKAAPEEKVELRLWLRLLTCSTLIETEVRRRLREEFAITLPRFDVLATLDHTRRGMTLGELSRHCMVSNGNITGVVESLVTSGHVRREPLPEDRRVQIVELTPFGRRAFARMARAHEAWVRGMLGDLPENEARALLRLLGRMKGAVLAYQEAAHDP